MEGIFSVWRVYCYPSIGEHIDALQLEGIEQAIQKGKMEGFGGARTFQKGIWRAIWGIGGRPPIGGQFGDYELTSLPPTEWGWHIYHDRLVLTWTKTNYKMGAEKMSQIITTCKYMYKSKIHILQMHKYRMPEIVWTLK